MDEDISFFLKTFSMQRDEDISFFLKTFSMQRD